MLSTYPEIRDRTYGLARELTLRVEWAETGRSVRLLLLYDRAQIVVGRATVPVRDLRLTVLTNLERDLAHVFGEGLAAMTSTVPTTRHLKFRVSLEETLDTKMVVWGADPIDAPIRSGVSARTLAELFEEVEAIKHFILDLPAEVPVSVEYVYEIAGVPHDLLHSYQEERAHLHRAAAEMATLLRRAGVTDDDSAALLGLSDLRTGDLQRS
ncbi:hypothetical protein DQ384_15545 [Sphaerisporangium album]|uniref:Uncharacterized protein n=1 Tax=Sphaerisporangium album TaxID=509200 RepID=A0A367FKJ2_9ACTN|nr:hypothetical protein [Sphaerisporangium album]RCG30170.1 hypothetical protein DQ384_15545 [Sphaerisporangium album]